MKLKYKILLGLMLLLSIRVSGQMFDQTMYNMKYIPQSIYQNPALMPAYSVNIGLPGISSLYYNGFHNGFSAKNFITLQPDDSVFIDIDNGLSKMGKLNTFSPLNLSVDYLHAGFKTGQHGYIHFNATEHIRTRLTYPKDFFELIWKGNGAFLGETADLSGLGIDINHYREFAIGYAHNLMDDKLTLGGTIKLLMGAANITTKKSDLRLHTDSTNFDLTVDGEFDVRSSGIIDWPLPDSAELGFSPGAYLINFADAEGNFPESDPGAYLFKGNMGVGLDLGAVYRFNDKFRVSASALDLGFIRWSKNVTNGGITQGTFTFSGIELNDWPSDADSTFGDSLLQNLGDSLAGIFDTTFNHDAYSQGLPKRFNLAANYALSEKLDFGILATGELFKGRFRPSATLSANVRLGRVLSTSLSWSYMNRTAGNIGLGLSLNGGPVQLYAVTDNILSWIGPRYVIPGVFSEKDSLGNVTDPGPFNGNLGFPQASRTRHVHVGLNITIGFKKRDRDKDGIPDKEDSCPDDPGPLVYQGCPDRDNDSIPDVQDDCPDIWGIPQFKGCPDTDKDGVMDSKDSCVTDYGLVEFDGCPDRDGDKIIDKKDKCPDKYGPIETQGCPDKDRDGVLDFDDACPEKPGPVEHQGCPDTDGDGLYDNEDRCVDEPGPTENFGCPWGDLDKDGVLDKEDRCPDTYGPKENQGCPYGDLDGDGVTDNLDDCPNTPGPASNKGCPEVSEEIKKLLEKAAKTEFESGKSVIKPVSYSTLDTLVAMLKDIPEAKISMTGHTDNVGADATNLTLSKNRTLAVQKYLTDRGIPADRIIADWKGETQPIAPNTTPEGRQKNRRVDMKIVYQ